MTTIAYRDGVIAADSLVCAGPMRAGSVTKVGRSASGHLGGAAGSMDNAAAFVAWLMSGAEGELPPRSADFDGLLVNPSGDVFYVGEKGGPVAVSGPFFAIGSGERFAVAAMEMGATAMRAVEVAVKYDVNSAAPIISLSRAGTP